MKTETKIKVATAAISLATVVAALYAGYLVGRGSTSLIAAARDRIIGAE